MNVEQSLRAAVAAQILRDLDLHFALSLRPFAAGHKDAATLAAALASAHTGEGHVCVALDEFAGKKLFVGNGRGGIEAPSLEQWREGLRASGVVGAPGDFAPLILDEANRLYLARYFHFEHTIATHLLSRAHAPILQPDFSRTRERLAHYFPPEEETEGQRLAAAVALLRPLIVVAGGPGTGKTTTVTRLLALVVEQSWPHVPRIALVAPTGKAAARLSESIKKQKAILNCGDDLRAAIPEQACTLHRLLKALPGRVGFRHDARNPLHLDLLVVDEVSMVDLPTMARLLDALPDNARIVLLGDPDQLASVEAGSVLGDICNRGAAQNYSPEMCAALEKLGVSVPGASETHSAPLTDSSVVLQYSRRFGSESGIGRLARAINAGDAGRTLEELDEGGNDLLWRQPDQAVLVSAAVEKSLSEYAELFNAHDPESALAAFNRFRFLCALREGPFGVEALNRLAEQALRNEGRITGHERFYRGRPIMVTRNDYTLGLFNGDVGMVWPDEEGRLRAFFPRAEGGVKKFLLSRLPEHETVFAMTIHKSQGSEFDRCVVVMPDRDAPILSRELVYTGITRARHAVELWSTREIISGAVNRRILRRTGLREKLWGPSLMA